MGGEPCHFMAPHHQLQNVRGVLEQVVTQLEMTT